MFLSRSIKSLLTTWLAGLLALLPLTLTLLLLSWIVSLLNRFAGPSTTVGRLFASVGQPFVDSPVQAYLLGTLVLIVAIFPLGLAVQLGLKGPLSRLLNGILRRIPLLGTLYSLTDRFVGLLDKKEDADIGAMSPVWCFFGGDGVAVLALLPNPEPIDIEGRAYLAVLVPTAPIPVGGGLLYIPADWVRPANIGIETFTSIYVSMGLTPPTQAKPGKVRAGQVLRAAGQDGAAPQA
jgi:uncharacterized membrane protein